MRRTITYRGIEFDVEFDYDPAEERTRECEGWAAKVTEIHEFKHQGTCFLEWIEGDEDVNDSILEQISD